MVGLNVNEKVLFPINYNLIFMNDMIIYPAFLWINKSNYEFYYQKNYSFWRDAKRMPVSKQFDAAVVKDESSVKLSSF